MFCLKLQRKEKKIFLKNEQKINMTNRQKKRREKKVSVLSKFLEKEIDAQIQTNDLGKKRTKSD